MKKFSMLTSVLIVMTIAVQAQNFYSIRRTRNLLLNVGLGTANYDGEMVNPGQLGLIRPNIALGAEYYFSPHTSIRSELTVFQISGKDSHANDDRNERNLHFRSNNIELSVSGAFNLKPMGRMFYQRPPLNFHVFAGIGVLRFNPKAAYDGKWVALQPLETEGIKYSRMIPVIPFGLGARMVIQPFFNILLEGGYRITFSDYLDDASSTYYPDPASLKSDLSRALSDRRGEIGTKPSNYLVGRRGNPGKNDGYFISNVTLQYYFPREILRMRQHNLYKTKRKKYYRRVPPRKKYYRSIPPGEAPAQPASGLEKTSSGPEMLHLVIPEKSDPRIPPSASF